MANVDVWEAIKRADGVLPGVPTADGEIDPRWQAIIEIGEHIEHEPDAVWDFVAKWGVHPDPDLRMAIATCLLEHLLQHHFELIFPRVEALVGASATFAECFQCCAQIGQACHEHHAIFSRNVDERAP